MKTSLISGDSELNIKPSILSTKLRCFAPSVINDELLTRPSTAMSETTHDRFRPY